jgi:hypothetical protein
MVVSDDWKLEIEPNVTVPSLIDLSAALGMSHPTRRDPLLPNRVTDNVTESRVINTEARSLAHPC